MTATRQARVAHEVRLQQAEHRGEYRLPPQDHHRRGNAKPHVAGAAGRSESWLPDLEYDGRPGNARKPSGGLNSNRADANHDPSPAMHQRTSPLLESRGMALQTTLLDAAASARASAPRLRAAPGGQRRLARESRSVTMGTLLTGTAVMRSVSWKSTDQRTDPALSERMPPFTRSGGRIRERRNRVS
jgi:hypothetical protein